MIALGKIDKGQKCSEEGCGKPAVRSVNVEKAKVAGIKFEGRDCYVCEEHYKQFKKGSKKVDQIEKWRYSG